MEIAKLNITITLHFYLIGLFLHHPRVGWVPTLVSLRKALQLAGTGWLAVHPDS